MSAQKPQNAKALKQKSLMGWFAKAPANGSSPAPAKTSQKTPAPPKELQSAVKGKDNTVKMEVVTPPQKRDAAGNGAGVAQSSSVKSLNSSSDASHVDTPPTSDAVDVDMLFQDEIEESAPAPVSLTFGGFWEVFTFALRRTQRERPLQTILTKRP